MNEHDRTIESYNQNAEAISAKFRALGPRIEDIERAVALFGEGTPERVVELGSGDGRDAPEIAKRSGYYIGVEPSAGLLDIASRENPNLIFVQSTAQDFDFPIDTDIIFAFASLLHVNKKDLTRILSRIHASLRIGGIAYISLKEAPVYTPRLDNDLWGARQFYLYSLKDIEEIAPESLEIVYEDHQELKGTPWLTVALHKIS